MSNNKKIIFSILIAITITALLPAVVLAATKSTYLTNQHGTTDAPKLIGRIIKASLGVVGSVALLMFIYGGFLWLTSAGSPDKITKGKNVIVWAVIGLVVIFLSYTMVDFVINKALGGKSTSSGQTSNVTTGGCCQDTIGAVSFCSGVSDASECAGTGKVFYAD